MKGDVMEISITTHTIHHYIYMGPEHINMHFNIGTLLMYADMIVDLRLLIYW